VSILPAHIPARQAKKAGRIDSLASIPGLLKRLQIRVQLLEAVCITSRKNKENDKEDLLMSSLILYLKAGYWD
jgi:hypothetical protein